MTQNATDPTEPTELSFEAGYERLQKISGRLNEDEVPVSEMCDLFAEGKGLEIALTGFLDTQRGRVDAIERGEGIRAFHITRTPSSAPSDSSGLLEFDAGDFEIKPTPPLGAADDDIPF